MRVSKYHPCEIDKMLKSLVVLVDTREQPTERAKKRYEQFGCAYERKALKFGDYSAVITDIDGNEISLENIAVVERKMNLDELCNCFCQGRERFRKEFEKALNAHAHVYLLIENNSLDDAYNGTYRSKMTANSLTASIYAWCIEFEIVPLFISEKLSGKAIKDILHREAKWYLEKQEKEVEEDD